MPNALQIGRKKTPDPNFRMYFSRETLSDRIEGSLREFRRRVKSPFLAAVLEIPGICGAQVSTYELIVNKAGSFDWSEIEPNLLQLLTSFNAGQAALLVPDLREEKR